MQCQLTRCGLILAFLLQLAEDKFDMLVHSPLARAKETAEIIWGDRKGLVHVLRTRRKRDLYSFQVSFDRT